MIVIVVSRSFYEYIKINSSGKEDSAQAFLSMLD